MVKFGIKKLLPGAMIPTRTYELDAGWDLYAYEHAVVSPGGVTVVRSGIGIDIPAGWEVQVRSRSGLAAKYGVHVLNAPGTVDAGYQGDVSAILINHGTSPFLVTPGMRVAQLLFKQVPAVELFEIETFPPSVRGTNGFGSSGR